MVWLYHDDIARVAIPTLIARLENIPNLNDSHKQSLKEDLKTIQKYNSKDFRPIFQEVIWICNERNWEEMINTGLQIERLRHYFKWGLGILVILFIAFPILINPSIFRVSELGGNVTTIVSIINTTSGGYWNFGLLDLVNWIRAICGIGWHIINLSHLSIISWTTALGTAIFGATGGYLSGLLQTRSSKTNLGLYEESVNLSQLRFVFGGIAGLVTCILLSWNLLTDIKITTLGPIILAAFLSGFSERYFVKLLKIDPENWHNGKNEIVNRNKKYNGNEVNHTSHDDDSNNDLNGKSKPPIYE